MLKQRKYKIVDNFLLKDDFLRIKEMMLSGNFPWNYMSNVSSERSNDSIYFIHLFQNKLFISTYINLLLPVFEKIQPKSLIRVKGNFYPPTNKLYEHENHVDYDFKHKGLILYVNTNNGFTILKNGEKVESIENRALLFDPSIEHRSTTCTDAKGRININFNYF